MTWRTLPAAVLAAALTMTSVLASAPVRAATLTLACDAVGLAAEVCLEGAQQWARQNGHAIKLIPVPRSGSRRLDLYKQLLGAQSPAIDIYMIDIVWPGVLARSFVDLSKPAAATIGQHFPGIVRNNTVNGRLIAMPWFTDAGLMFYRKDLLARYKLPVPATWDELERTAARIQDAERGAGKRDFWGYVWQARAYEGLSCAALEWMVGHGGGAIVREDGQVTIDNPRASSALQMARNWIGTISPKSVLTSDEDDALGAFSAGKVAFMRNWPYAWAIANGPASGIRGQVGIAPLPRGPGGISGATLGGQQLAVSRFSRNQALAIDLVMYLTGRAEQKRRAITLGVHPTIVDLYDDPAIAGLNPYQRIIRDVIAGATARPSTVTGEQYEAVSSAFWDMARGVLADGRDPATSVKELDAHLRALGRAHWQAGARR